MRGRDYYEKNEDGSYSIVSRTDYVYEGGALVATYTFDTEGLSFKEAREKSSGLLLFDDNGALFMRVLARAFAEHDDRLRQFLSENYGHVMRQFTAEFARLLPQLGKRELYWRIDLVTGALTHAMSGFGMIQRPKDVSERAHREQTAQHLIRFAVAGLSHV